MAAGKKATKSELVYSELYRAITHADLAPKTKLTVKEIAAEYNVSEIPVREALQRLSSEGMLQYTKYAGYEVPAFSAERLHWLWEIKLALELYASGLAAEKCTSEDIRVLSENIQRSYQILSEGKSEEFEHLNREFHMRIYEASGNPLLCREIEKYWNQTIKIRGPYSFKYRNVTRSVKEHEVMLHALEEHDVGKLQEMVKQQRVENWEQFSVAYQIAAELFGAGKIG